MDPVSDLIHILNFGIEPATSLSVVRHAEPQTTYEDNDDDDDYNDDDNDNNKTSHSNQVMARRPKLSRSSLTLTQMLLILLNGITAQVCFFQHREAPVPYTS